MSTGAKVVPPVKWAERNETVLLSVDLVDVTAGEARVTLEPSGKLSFAWRNYAIEMELLKEVDVEKSKWGFDARAVRFSIAKKEPGYWNKLLKTGKPTWLSVDWARWKDEDDEDEQQQQEAPGFADLGGGNGFDFNSMMAGMGGGEGGEEEGGDSDDDEMPDLEGDTGSAPAPAPAEEEAAAPAPAAAATAEAEEAEKKKKEEEAAAAEAH